MNSRCLDSLIAFERKLTHREFIGVPSRLAVFICSVTEHTLVAGKSFVVKMAI